MQFCLHFLFFILLCSIQNRKGEGLSKRDIEHDVRQFLAELNERGSQECEKMTVAAWNFQINITEENQKKKTEGSLKMAEWNKDAWGKSKAYQDFLDLLENPKLNRQLKLMSVLGKNALPEDKLKQLNDVIAKMVIIYSNAKLCSFHDHEKCDLSLNPELTEILRTSRNAEELKYYWQEWRNNVGRPIKDLYPEYVRLQNEAAQLNGMNDMGKLWTSIYEEDSFEELVDELWVSVKPLYLELHAYVRRKLREAYGEDLVSREGPVPAHLLGNMWSQTWDNIFDFLKPFPQKQSANITERMMELGITPRGMFEMADEFFISLGLPPLPPAFWRHSMLEKPENRSPICNPSSAFDFCNGRDYRISQCTVVTLADLITVHHEMGHIQYYIQYSDQPFLFRTGANPGFHEAIGDVISLSVTTPKHLKAIGLLDKLVDDGESQINRLMEEALQNIAFLPFAYVLDTFRWKVFSGEIEEKDWNCAYWDLRIKHQGIKPPNERKNSDFDPGAKYHVPADIPYIRYLISKFLQFQIHKALCERAHEYDPLNPLKPLHKCDIYRSRDAGKALIKLLKAGNSQPWPDTLQELTGSRKIDPKPILEYFKPLENWLRQDNLRNGEHIGWTEDGNYCSGGRKTCMKRSLIIALFVNVFLINTFL